MSTALLALTGAFLAGATEPPVVKSVELHLPPGAATAAYERLVSVPIGRPLSRRAVRRTVERLYESGTVADVDVLARPHDPGAIDLIIRVVLKQYLDRLVIAGNAVLAEDAIRRAAEFGERTEYYPERIDRIRERVADAYRRIGHAAAQVEPQVLEEGGRLFLSLTIIEGPPTRVAAIVAAGDPAADPAAFAGAVGIDVGDVLNADALDLGVDALRRRYREAGHYRARVDPAVVTVDGTRAVVAVPVLAGPRIRFAFRGNRSFDGDELRRRIAYDPQEPLDATVLSRLTARLRDFYRAMGFFDARVHPREITSPDGHEAVVAFHVFEGRRLTVTSVSFEGVQHLEAAVLRDLVDDALDEAEPESPLILPPTAAEAGALGGSGREAPAHGGWLRPEMGRAFVDAAYADASRRIEGRYRRAGFLSAEVERVEVTLDAGVATAPVRIVVREGIQTRVQSVEVVGAPDGARAGGLVPVEPGQPLNPVDVEAGRMAVLKELNRRGYLYARVEDEELLTEDAAWASVVYRCRPGHQVRVNRILVREEGQDLSDRVRGGAARTHEGVVRRSLEVAEGDVFHPEALERSQRNLLRLGIFSSAILRASPPEGEEGLKDLVVDVKERKAIAVEGAIGFSLGDGPRWRASVSHANVLGRAVSTSAQAKASYFNASYQVLTDPTRALRSPLNALAGRLNVGAQAPGLVQLLPPTVVGRLDGIVEQVHRPAYEFTRFAGVAGGEWTTSQRLLSLGVQYEVESDFILKAPNVPDEVSKQDLDRLQFENGRTVLQSVRTSVSLDLRDDAANPRKYGLFAGTAELVAGGGREEDPPGVGQEQAPARCGDKPDCDFTVLLLKVSGNVNWYVQVRPGMVLAVSGRAGGIVPLVKDSKTVPPKRFFLGGPGSMRGYKEDGMLSEDRRRQLHGDVQDCRRLVNSVGCTATALRLAEGREIASDGGELFVNGRGELRFALGGDIEAAMFVDAGNLWLDPLTFELAATRFTGGVGMRVVTPIGPVVLDFGVKLFPDRVLNETWFEPHFSIGLF